MPFPSIPVRVDMRAGCLRSATPNLDARREADEVRAETEACTLASRQADRGREKVQDGEDGGGNNGDNRDLLDVRGLVGDDDHRDGNGEALQEILDYARHKLRNSESVHGVVIHRGLKKNGDGRADLRGGVPGDESR